MPISTFPCHDYDEDEYILKPAGLRDTHSEGKVKLLPDIDAQGGTSSWWDFCSFGTLVRSLFEVLLFFRYFTEQCSDAEWLAKLNLMQLNDCTERIRYFTTTEDDEEVKGFQLEQEVLIRKLEANPVIQAIEAKQRKQLLYGWRPSILTQREIATKFNIPEKMWSHFQFLSSYTHSLPMSFYRTSDHKRDGTHNDVDRGYFAVTLSWIMEILKESTDFYEHDIQSAKDSKNRLAPKKK
jgi:hypothetical protein